MNMNIIKNFRQAKQTCFSHGQIVGYMNKWVDGTFGPVIGWTVYSAGGDFISHATDPDEAWGRLFAWIDDRNRAFADPF